MTKTMLKLINGNMVEYELRDLVDQYAPILRTKTKDVVFGKDNASFLAFTLAETLTHLGGLGLAANQIGLPYRLCAINTGDHIWVMINPKITHKSNTLAKYKEGCLSFPGLYLQVNRPESITLQFQAIGGEWVEKDFDGLTATVIQHEIDHLDGICYTSLVSPIKLDMAKRKVKSNIKRMKNAVGA